MENLAEEAITVLKKLGLSILGARVYVTLATAKSMTVDEIAKNSKVHRPDVYRIVRNLEEKGLVEKEIASPTKYRAIPLEAGFDFLLKKRAKESIDILEQTNKTIRDFKAMNNLPIITESPRIILIPRTRVVDRLGEALNKAIDRIEIVTTKKQFESRMFFLTEHYKSAWERGIKMNMVIENPQDFERDLLHLDLCKENSLCKLKFVDIAPKTIVEIIDREEVFINEDPEKGLSDSPAFFSRNPAIVELTKSYFESFWFNSRSPE